MLYQFLAENRTKILADTRLKEEAVAGDKPTTTESERGLPQFYDFLTGELEREAKGLPPAAEKSEGADTTTKHGAEMKRLGYTVSQVVQGYGVLCQAITEQAEAAGAPISVLEFKTLNGTLDTAIARAVTGFASRVGVSDCAKKLSLLARELRGTLSAASIAHSMIKKGVVGAGGSTNALLERSLDRMRDIIDRSFSEVRMLNESDMDFCPVFLLQVAEELEATASDEARALGLTLDVQVDAGLQVVADPHYLISAMSYLVRNALKHSKKGETVILRSRETDDNAVLEVEDRCGGLPKGMADQMLRPTAKGTGASPGLEFSRLAVARGGGALAVRDIPGTGCVFSVIFPKHAKARPAAVKRPAPSRKAQRR